MLLRGVAVWLGILILANLNGALRELLLRPALGETMARVLSTVLLVFLVLLVTWVTIRWIGPPTARAALEVGLVWLLLTLVFEFGAGHYLFDTPWTELLADYDLRRGRIWVLVPITTLLAPLWVAWTRGLVGAGQGSTQRPVGR